MNIKKIELILEKVLSTYVSFPYLALSRPFQN